jgi:hypothetical protein
MKRSDGSSTPGRIVLSLTRVWLPILIAAAGVVLIVLGHGRVSTTVDNRSLLSGGGVALLLVGPAGAYLSRVVDRKTVSGSIVVILDGGVHHVLRPALVGQEHRIRAFVGNGERPIGGEGRSVPITVAGPLCSGLDVFSQTAVIRPPEVGDLVAVLDVGAYGFTESMPLFLSHPIPAEVAVRAGRAELIRPRQRPVTNVVAVFVIVVTLLPILAAYYLTREGEHTGGSSK